MDHDCRRVRRGRANAVLVQFDLVVAIRQRRGPKSVACNEPRVADSAHAAETRQLGQGPTGRASLGVRLQRARRIRRLHSAKRAAQRADASERTSRVVRMSMTVAYGALILGIVIWAIIVRQLTVRPWEVQVATGSEIAPDTSRFATAKVGLWVFLAIVTSLFGLFMSAYYMRMGGHGHELAPDWAPVVEPRVLWLNSAFLVAGSVAMQWARTNVLRGHARRAFESLLIAGLLTLAFLGGQFFAWQQLEAAGFFSPSNPALAFFYLLTAVHALHLFGGLFVWARTLVRMRKREYELIEARYSIELCAIYWHYLLIVWLVLFALLLST